MIWTGFLKSRFIEVVLLFQLINKSMRMSDWTFFHPFAGGFV